MLEIRWDSNLSLADSLATISMDKLEVLCAVANATLRKKEEAREAERETHIKGLRRIKSAELQLFHMRRDPNDPDHLCADDTLPGPPVELSLLVRGYDSWDFEDHGDYPMTILDVDFAYTPENKKSVINLMNQLETQLGALLSDEECRVFSEVLGERDQ